MNWTHDQLAILWQANGGAKDAADTAAAIALAESSGNQYALLNTAYPNLPHYQAPAKGNLPEYSCGFWQINIYANTAYKAPAIFDPVANVKAAIALSRNGESFAPWSTYTHGTYKQYLTGKAGIPPVEKPPPVGGTPALPSSTPTSATDGWAQLRYSLDGSYTFALKHSKNLHASAVALLQ